MPTLRTPGIGRYSGLPRPPAAGEEESLREFREHVWSLVQELRDGRMDWSEYQRLKAEAWETHRVQSGWFDGAP